MAKKTPEKITRLKKKKPTRPCFFCCFGFSRKEKFSDNRSSVKSFNSRKGTIGLFSWSAFRMKNSSTKTVPLDTSDRSTDLSESKIHSSKSSNFKSKWKIPKLFSKRTNNSTTKATPFREVPTIVKQIIEERTQGPEQNNTPENRRSFDHEDTLKDSTCRKRLSFRRKVDAIRTGSSQRGSPGVIIKPNPKPARTNTTATLSHSVSMPILTGEKRVNPLSKVRVLPKKTRDDDSVMMFNKFDPVVGMSIIVVTLIIMFIWGRLCAVLCTAAWLYFVPRLRGLKNYDAMMKIDGDLDLNSEEYKKKVVLEGFLDRDHRAVL